MKNTSYSLALLLFFAPTLYAQNLSDDKWSSHWEAFQQYFKPIEADTFCICEVAQTPLSERYWLLPSDTTYAQWNDSVPVVFKGKSLPRKLIKKIVPEHFAYQFASTGQERFQVTQDKRYSYRAHYRFRLDADHEVYIVSKSLRQDIEIDSYLGSQDMVTALVYYTGNKLLENAEERLVYFITLHNESYLKYGSASGIRHESFTQGCLLDVDHDGSKDQVMVWSSISNRPIQLLSRRLYHYNRYRVSLWSDNEFKKTQDAFNFFNHKQLAIRVKSIKRSGREIKVKIALQNLSDRMFSLENMSETQRGIAFGLVPILSEKPDYVDLIDRHIGLAIDEERLNNLVIKPGKEAILSLSALWYTDKNAQRSEFEKKLLQVKDYRVMLSYFDPVVPPLPVPPKASPIHSGIVYSKPVKLK